MTIIKMEPMTEFAGFGENLYKTNEDFQYTNDINNSFSPKIDISEDEKNFYWEAELPAVKKEDINIVLKNNILTIKGQKRFSDEKKKKSLIFDERNYGSFERTFTLNEETNPDSAYAEFENGVLKIVIEKVTEKKTDKRQIIVK
ncbi:MAG: Hsp20/alpha crystallin family protein [Ignavibacteriaceae bacterium]|nr:Hsp20/alpha crystallin family protein [Ignavibacteriaceae bacterium]